MKRGLVYRENIVFEFYKAALDKEITVETFFKAREIVGRAQPISTRSMNKIDPMIYDLQTAFERIKQDAGVMSVSLNDAITKINAQIEHLEAKGRETV